MKPDIWMGQPSWRVSSATVEAWVTELGGHLGPVRFLIDDRWIEPFSVAPWHDSPDPADLPVLRTLRGDFFCLPFGHDPEPYMGESYPLHGVTANDLWEFDTQRGSTLDLILESKVRPCKVYKTVRCGDRVVYQKHTVIGLSGVMCFGMHAMIQFRTSGMLATSKIMLGQVFPGQFEDPKQGGYSSLKPGAEFDSLSEVPLAVGGTTNLTNFPAREGFEDLVQVAADPTEALAWAAVTFPDEGYVYFQLKNPRVLRSTVLWYSNGGRHYAPWNGRHRGVLGIEEVTAYFHLGLRGSVMPNYFQMFGVPTYEDCSPSSPLEVKVIHGVSALPIGFGRVAAIVPTGHGVVLVSEEGTRIECPLDIDFLGIR